QNWHLLSYEQLLQLLGWTAEKLEFILREDDFLWHKLGNAKPQLSAPRFAPLSPEQARATGQLRRWRQEAVASLPERREEPFAFLHKKLSGGSAATASAPGLRMIYPYAAVYGDPLLDDCLGAYPEQVLADYAAAGVNAIWLQAVLYTLVPWFGPSRYSQDCERRIANLRRLVQRMAKFRLKLILYINEPRGMPDEFFRQHPDWRGSKAANKDLYALCTSHPEVLPRLSLGVEELFRQVPELGGLFCITMSENLTNCWSKSSRENPPACPRCARQSPAEIVSGVIRALAEGVHRSSPAAEVIAWNWAWHPSWDEQVVSALPPGVKLMLVSETHLETSCCGGIKGQVVDYSISKPGPGPVFRRLLSCARAAGVPVIAKVQLNNSWENSAVPYLPVPGLVEEHLDNLRALDIEDFMVSWTLGGYPGGNLPLLTKRKEELFTEYFQDAGGEILSACAYFDRAFRLLPFNSTNLLYTGPQNYGPLNTLFEHPTGYRATMVGFPYDDLQAWRGIYPEDTFIAAFQALVELWGEGLARLQSAGKAVLAERQAHYRDLRQVAEAAYCHFSSSCWQMVFVQCRDRGEPAGMRSAVQAEKELALRLLSLCRIDSRLGFEASNHYYYHENTLLEKILNCNRLLQILPGGSD
ncbi:MAG: hypothetical protein GX564_11340, partial [Oligosphaeraceae bacterium]|nr:hypothetical protein [Oligosphaeraceae bacterium]